MKPVTTTVADVSRGVHADADVDTEDTGRREVSRCAKFMTPSDLRVMNAGQVDRRPRPSAHPTDGPVVAVETSNPNRSTVGEPGQVISRGHAPRGDRAGDDRAVSGDREDSIDREPEEAGVVARPSFLAESAQSLTEMADSVTRCGRSPHDLRLFEKGAGDQGSDVRFDEVEPSLIDQIALGEDDHAPGEAQQAKDFQVLTGLGHDGVVGRDDEHGEVQSGRAGEHISDETLVTRDVHERDPQPTEFELGETEINGNPPLLLGREAVGINAGQFSDKRGLAVVDMTRGPDNEVLGFHDPTEVSFGPGRLELHRSGGPV